jgi:hypothetical protein
MSIDLMGKYDRNTVPVDIASAFNLIGQMPLENYFEYFMQARMLIHPFANRYHNHYTNVEACTGGMPVLLLKGNPLYNENAISGGIYGDPESYGAFESIDRLIKGALELYNDREALENMASRQHKLLTPFSRDSVNREIGILLDLISQKRIEKEMQSQLTVFSRLPCADVYSLRKSFVEHADNIPIYAFLYEDHLVNTLLDEVGDFILRLTAEEGCKQLFLTDKDNTLAAGRIHKITLLGLSRGLGVINLTYEMWTSAGIIASGKCNFSCPNSDENFNISFDFVIPVPATLVLYISIMGSTVADFKSISHSSNNVNKNCCRLV